MSDDRAHTMHGPSAADESPHRPIRWLAPSEALLGGLGLAGLIGFAAILAFGSSGSPPPAAVAAPPPPAFSIIGGDRGSPGPQGPPGPKGEPGAAGPPGGSGVRILRVECIGGACTVQCEDDEMLLGAYCGTARSPATFPGERSASCRTRRPADFLVAACAKSSAR